MEHLKGRVYLVGAGPGASDLITVRGRHALRRAEVVIFDDLVSSGLLEEVPDLAETIYVGKREGHKTLEQEEICRLLVDRARQGHRVVRLKGGDPFVFGRGGEEAAALAEAGIPFEVIPGVSSAVAVPAFAGIPVTHRGLSDRFEVWTGHGGELHEEKSASGRTVVVLMGVKQLARNVEKIRCAGWPGRTPAAMIQWGSLSRQKTVMATLDTIVEAATDMSSPAVLVVGEVVALRDRLKWFEDTPLFGRRILVTRSRRQAEETCRMLEELGAETVAMPTIEIRPPSDPEPLRRAVRRLQTYDFLIVTSANAVDPLRRALTEAGLDGRAFAGLKICAIGPGTSKALGVMNLVPDLVPEDNRAEGILELLTEEKVAGKRILLPRAAKAREILPRTLVERGAGVDLVPVYETGLPDPEQTRRGRELLEEGAVDVLTFTSASTVENFATIVGEHLAELCRNKVIVAIGPVTREACQRVGLKVDVMPRSFTIEAMAASLVEFLQTQR